MARELVTTGLPGHELDRRHLAVWESGRARREHRPRDPCGLRAVSGSRASCAGHRDSRFGAVDSGLGRRARHPIVSAHAEGHLSLG